MKTLTMLCLLTVGAMGQEIVFRESEAKPLVTLSYETGYLTVVSPYDTVFIREESAVVRMDSTGKRIPIEWLGWIGFYGPYSGIDPGFYGANPPPAEYYRTDIEIGLRPDGVVIWRKVK